MRFGAAIVDFCIASFVTFILMEVLFELIFPSLAEEYDNYAMGFPLYVWFLLSLYHLFFTALKGQTPGKMLFRIKVVDAQGKKPTVGLAFLREVLGRMISTLALGIGFFCIAGDPQKQGWHDEIAETFVVKARARQNVEPHLKSSTY